MRSAETSDSTVANWNNRLMMPVILLLLRLAIQPLWMAAPYRYARYITYLLIGVFSALLGKTIMRQKRPFLFPGLLTWRFITTYFLAFDAWTLAQRFRPRYQLAGCGITSTTWPPR